MKFLKMFVIASILLISACSNSPANEQVSQQNSAALIYTAAAMTEDVNNLPADTPFPTSTFTPEISINPTDIPKSMVPVPVQADLVNLRSGPGTFFNTLASLEKGTQVYTLGMISDGSWIKVNVPDLSGGSIDGWIFASLLDLSSLKTSLSILNWPTENTISGTVTDLEGNPINAVRIAASIETEIGGLRAEGQSDRNGSFNIFSPQDLTGPFSVEIVAVNCSSTISAILPDGTCAVQDHIPVNWKAETYLPQSQPITFIYEQGVAYLEGKVVYQDGNGASQILIKASRISDGVESEYVTPQGGTFRLPLGLGTWDVIAIRFLPDGTPLISETHTFQISAPGQELEPLLISYSEIIER